VRLVVYPIGGFSEESIGVALGNELGVGDSVLPVEGD